MFLQTQLLNENGLITIGGLVTLVVVISQSFRYAFNLQAKWIGLLISAVVSSLSTYLTTDNSTSVQSRFY